MTETILKEIVHRAVRDGAYRAQLQRDPSSALAGYSLSADERSAIASGDPARLTALGVDQRMSKAFAAGVMGDANKAVIAYEPGAAGAVLDETAATVRSPMWRLEQDLHPGDAAIAVEPETVRSPMWRLEQDLYDANAARAATEADDVSGIRLTEFEHEGGSARADVAPATSTEVTDLNQDANWDGGPQLTEN